ncbi:MAG TPA: M14 family metallopeptidase [Flavobacterium sp.]|jgi:hypothetical protein
MINNKSNFTEIKKMIRVSPIACLICFCSFAQGKDRFLTPYEKGNSNQTATYDETISYFEKLAFQFETVSMSEMGMTDSGEPLHIVTFNADGDTNFMNIGNGKLVLLINNGIHPGEPDGIDATMMLFRDLATGKIQVPENVIIVNIPVYNIGGALNRNSTSRVNQNGPEEYGFRGNARNYDLNRDFVKADTRNTRSFSEIFHKVNPDVFIDNHVSNGANYQYVFTYIATHHQKIGGKLGTYWKEVMLPQILSQMKSKNIDAIPYVNVHDQKPDDGFDQFMDYPRYSTGYTSMFNTLGSMPETHMLKEYATRVQATYQYMVETIAYAEKNAAEIKKLRAENQQNYKPNTSYPLRWAIDSSKVTAINFNGYEGSYKPSDISGKPRLYYDESKPFSRKIEYRTEYTPTLEVIIPTYYIVPKSWWNVIELLKINHIQMTPLEADTTIEVESYRIIDYKTSGSPYEGHYPHSDVRLRTTKENVHFNKGDLVISTQQRGVKYLLETLEPQGIDSFFSWNFFDAILQQKEYFSAYVFEDLARELLDADAALRSEFENLKKKDAKFAASGEMQLDWIYRHSKYYERTHLQYPVYRKMN